MILPNDPFQAKPEANVFSKISKRGSVLASPAFNLSVDLIQTFKLSATGGVAMPCKGRRSVWGIQTCKQKQTQQTYTPKGWESPVGGAPEFRGLHHWGHANLDSNLGSC